MAQFFVHFRHKPITTITMETPETIILEKPQPVAKEKPRPVVNDIAQPVTEKPAPANTNEPAPAIINSVWNVLRLTFGIVPIVAGLDKFTDLLVNWDMYLNPLIAS